MIAMERTGRWPRVPWWAVALLAVYLALVTVYVLVTQAQGRTAPPLCILKRLTGVPCPTCGTTRMFLAAGRGDWSAAIAANPLVSLVTVVAAALLLLRIAFRRRVVWINSPTDRRLCTVAIVLAVLVNWLYLLTRGS